MTKCLESGRHIVPITTQIGAADNFRLSYLGEIRFHILNRAVLQPNREMTRVTMTSEGIRPISLALLLGPALALAVVNDGTDPILQANGSNVILGDLAGGAVNNTVIFRTNGADRALFDVAGRFGIGPSVDPGSFSSSANQLVVSGPGNSGITISTPTTANGALYFADGTENSDPYRGFLQYYHDGDKMVLGTSGATRLTINGSGQVGIGTDMPGRKFEVVAPNGDGIRVKAFGEESSANLFLEPASASSNKRNWVLSAYHDTHGDFSIRNSNTANDNPYGSGGTTRFLINRDGNIGVGTVNPRSRLDVNGNVTVTGNIILEGEGRTIGSAHLASHNDYWKIFMDGQTSDNGALHIRTGDNGNEPIYFEQTSNDGVNRVRMIIAASGKVGIGTDDPYEQLHVVGTTRIDGDLQVSSIRTKTWTVAPDYVFEKDYKLRSLEEVDAFVKKNKHLPEVPSAKMIKEKGLDLAEMNLLLLKKVEELTLHAIRQEKEMNTRSRAMETELARQAEEIRRLRHRAK